MKCNEKEQENCDVEKRGCEGCIYNEKNADEMFEELGYKKIIDNDGTIFYQCKRTEMGERFEFNILFIKTSKLVKNDHLLNMQELQAIYKKCQELGWIE